MRYLAFVCALAFAAVAMAAEAPRRGSSVNQAAAFYHQGRFDSALVHLESLKSQGPWKRRDSLSLFQYLGMASARLGHETEAVGYFSRLLELDSLFQFPRNEDSQVLQAFARAQEQRVAAPSGLSAFPTSAPAPPASLPGNAAGPADSARTDKRKTKSFSMIDSGGPAGKASPPSGSIGLAMGAMPLGAGWLARHKVRQGLAFGLLQAGGIVVSMYASGMQSRETNDAFRIRNKDELATIQAWQWVQRISLSTALGAYLFSLIASAGD
jgi:tetratricopeptide (TPR) repeat protein